MVKNINEKKIKCLFTDLNQFPVHCVQWLPRMLPLSCTRQYNIVSNTTYSINENTCYCITGRPGPPLLIRLLQTILVGAIF